MRDKTEQPDRFCELMRQIDAASLALFDAVEDTAGVARYQAAMAETARLWLAQASALDASANPAIRGDLATILAAYRAYVAGNTGALEAAAYNDAFTRMEAWLEEHCGMVLTDPDEP